MEDLKIGQHAQFTLKLTKKSHEEFKQFSGDTSPVHNDDEFAQTAGFDERIAYGFHILSYFSRFYGTVLPGGSSICLSQTAKFTKPVYIGEEITVKGTIIHMNPHIKTVTIKNEVLNSKGEVCVLGEAVVKIVEGL
ncbi:MAG: MaoC family dehydratase [Nanoarchaeota archaeon]